MRRARLYPLRFHILWQLCNEEDRRDHNRWTERLCRSVSVSASKVFRIPKSTDINSTRLHTQTTLIPSQTSSSPTQPLYPNPTSSSSPAHSTPGEHPCSPAHHSQRPSHPASDQNSKVPLVLTAGYTSPRTPSDSSSSDRRSW